MLQEEYFDNQLPEFEGSDRSSTILDGNRGQSNEKEFSKLQELAEVAMQNEAEILVDPVSKQDGVKMVGQPLNEECKVAHPASPRTPDYQIGIIDAPILPNKKCSYAPPPRFDDSTSDKDHLSFEIAVDEPARHSSASPHPSSPSFEIAVDEAARNSASSPWLSSPKDSSAHSRRRTISQNSLLRFLEDKANLTIEVETSIGSNASFVELLPETKQSFIAPPHPPVSLDNSTKDQQIVNYVSNLDFFKKKAGSQAKHTKKLPGSYTPTPIPEKTRSNSEKSLDRSGFSEATQNFMKIIDEEGTHDLFMLRHATRDKHPTTPIMLPSDKMERERSKTVKQVYRRHSRIGSVKSHSSLAHSIVSSATSQWDKQTFNRQSSPAISELNAEGESPLALDHSQFSMRLTRQTSVPKGQSFVEMAHRNRKMKNKLQFHNAIADEVPAAQNEIEDNTKNGSLQNGCIDWLWNGVSNPVLRKECLSDKSRLSLFIFGCIFANIILLSMDSYGISDTMAAVMYYSNLVFVAIFSAEMIFKLVIIGIHGYFKQIGNVIDAVIVAASWVELILLTASSSFSALRVLTRVFRAARVTRISKLAHRWPALLKVLRILINSFQGVGPAMCLAILLMFVYSVLGMQLFGMYLNGEGDSEEEIRFRFDSFKWAFFSVFYLIVGDDWTTIMDLAIVKTSMWACVYFIFVILTGNWVLVNLILAIVLSGCTQSINNRTEVTLSIHRLNLRIRRLYLRYAMRIFKEVIKNKRRCIEVEIPMPSGPIGLQFGWPSNQEEKKDMDPIFVTHIAEEASQDVQESFFEGDVLLSVNGNSVKHFTEIEYAFSKLNPGERVKFDVSREERHFKKKIKKRESEHHVQFCRQWTRKDSKTHTSELCLINIVRDERSKMHDLPISFFEIYKEASRKSPRYSFIEMSQVVTKKEHGMWFVFTKICCWLSDSKHVHNFMTLIVLISWFVMFETEISDPIWSIELVCTILFAAEVAWKCVAKGVFRGEKPYAKSWWNVMDFALVIISAVLLGLEQSNSTGTAYQVFTCLKAFRPTRLISKLSDCRQLFEALFHSLTSLGTVGALIFACWFIYSLIGMQLFKGTFFSCSNEDFPEGAYRWGTNDSDGGYITPPCEIQYFDLNTGMNATYTWDNQIKNFDTIYNSMALMFYVSTLEGWMTPLFSAVDMVGENYQPATFRASWAFLFFLVGCSLFGFYLVNLLVAAVFESFVENTSYSDDGVRLDATQRIMKMYQKRLCEVKPKKRPKPEDPGKFGIFMNKIARSKKFKVVVVFVLCLNGIILMTSHAEQSTELTRVQSAFNVFFAVFFLIEACIKIIGLGRRRYFSSSSHLFDFVVAMSAVTGVIFYFGFQCAYDSNFLLQLFITLRIFRTLSLISHFKVLRLYMMCLLYPMPKLLNIFLLMLIGVFIYASIGYQIFYNVEFESAYTNFKTLRNSLQVMTICVTGEFASFIETTLEDSNTNVPTALTYFFYCSFFIMMSFLLVNMFVMFIVETFELLSSNSVNLAIEQLIPRYRKIWSKYDPEATGFINPKDLPQFLLDLPSEIGVCETDPYLYLVHMLDRIEMQPNYDYSFNKTLVSVCVIASYPESLAEVETSLDLYMLFRKVWAVIVIKRAAKKYIMKWKVKNSRVN